MSAKSYVTMAQKMCPVCGVLHDTGEILLDRRLKNTFDPHTTTGYALCPEHQKLKDDGYIALVGVDEAKSTAGPLVTITMDNAYRTGAIAHVRETVFRKIFTGFEDKPVPEMVFVSEDVLTYIKNLQQTAASK